MYTELRLYRMMIDVLILLVFLGLGKLAEGVGGGRDWTTFNLPFHLIKKSVVIYRRFN